MAAEASHVHEAPAHMNPKALRKEAVKGVSHAEPTTVLEAACARTKTTSEASLTLQCQCVTPTLAESLNGTVA